MKPEDITRETDDASAVPTRAERLQIERELMRAGGVASRSDVQGSLRNGLMDFQKQLAAQAASSPPAVERPASGPLLTIERPTVLDTRPFSQPNQNAVPNASGPGTASGGTITLTLCKNGVPTQYTLLGAEVT